MKLLDELESTTTKRLYQGFLVEQGIDRVEVIVPMEHAESFLKEASHVQPKTRAELVTILKHFEGKIS